MTSEGPRTIPERIREPTGLLRESGEIMAMTPDSR
jgi:hypothetical protein